MQANPELTAIWAVGQHIWQRDFPGIYTAIAAYQWSENILPVMEALRGKTLIQFNISLCKYQLYVSHLTQGQLLRNSHAGKLKRIKYLHFLDMGLELDQQGAPHEYGSKYDATRRQQQAGKWLCVTHFHSSSVTYM